MYLDKFFGKTIIHLSIFIYLAQNIVRYVEK